jgi:hypothetical protein
LDNKYQLLNSIYHPKKRQKMENNPTKQYFRRPIMYFRLPSDGRYYDSGVVEFPANRELAVYAMTAIDEMTIRTPDALFNGTAVAELVKNCIPGITQPWKINTVDLEAVLVAIRAASNNGKIEISSVCPSCKEDAKYDINLMSVLGQLKNVDYNQPLEIGPLKIKFRPLTYIEVSENDIKQFDIQRNLSVVTRIEDEEEKNLYLNKALKKMNDLIIDIMTDSIEYIETPETKVHDSAYIREFIISTDRQTVELIKNHGISLKEKSDMPPLNITCIHCSHEYDQKFIMNVSNFFRLRLLNLDPSEMEKLSDEMEKERKEIFFNAQRISWYMRGGINFTDIMNMSSDEIENLNKIIDENLETTKKSKLPFF